MGKRSRKFDERIFSGALCAAMKRSERGRLERGTAAKWSVGSSRIVLSCEPHAWGDDISAFVNGKTGYSLHHMTDGGWQAWRTYRQDCSVTELGLAAIMGLVIGYIFDGGVLPDYVNHEKAFKVHKERLVMKRESDYQWTMSPETDFTEER